MVPFLHHCSSLSRAATEAIQEQALTDLRIYLHDHTDTIKIPEELIDSMGFMGLAKEIPVAHVQRFFD